MIFQYFNINNNAAVIISIAIILFSGFLITRLTKKFKLPNVTGYIIAGILIGPYMLNIIPESVIHDMDFVTDVALAFIAFGVGKYLKLSTLKENSSQVIIITLFEALTAAVIISLTMIFVFRLSVGFSLLLGAIGSATAPASTIMTIRQYKAKGNFVNMILQVVALDDAVALIAFSICAAVAQAMGSNEKLNAALFLIPVIMNAAAIILGIASGFILNKLINNKRTQDNKLILAVSMILVLAGFCASLDISPLLACMAMGTAYINISKNKEIFKMINGFSPPILTLFFVLSGMKLNVPSLMSAGVIGIVYFIVRIIGKYLGAYMGAVASKASAETRNYFGMALVPQAGVSIGLAILGQRMLPTEMGSMLSTIILSSGVLYEIVGPACAKAALYLSKSIPDTEITENFNMANTNIISELKTNY